MPMSVLEAYDAKLNAGALTKDARQRAIAKSLDELQKQLSAYKPQTGRSLISRLFAGAPPRPPKGLYIWGGVGRGKTMLMDMFFDTLDHKSKRRAHFLSFMRDVHARIHRIREKQRAGEIWEDNDPIHLVADEVVAGSAIVCFDEFQVSDISDAMILSRLFTAFFERGCVVVATSNVVPDELYKDGLNRNAFLPFIDILRDQMQVLPLDGETDYRLGRLAEATTYLTPLDSENRKAFEALWRIVTDEDLSAARPDKLTINGRDVAVPNSARRTAMFGFEDLCENPLGPNDYLAIAECYKTVFLANVPVLDADMRNQTKRFITLIDALYDAGTRLVITAAAPPEALHQLSAHKFEFERTLSRLNEMQSADYFNRPGQ